MNEKAQEIIESLKSAVSRCSHTGKVVVHAALLLEAKREIERLAHEKAIAETKLALIAAAPAMNSNPPTPTEAPEARAASARTHDAANGTPRRQSSRTSGPR